MRSIAVGVALWIGACAGLAPEPQPVSSPELEQAFEDMKGGTLGASEEPPLLFALGDGETWRGLRAGGSVELPPSDETRKLTLELAPFRQFDTHGVAFRYPREMTYEADHDMFLKTWVLSGNSSKIMIFQYPSGEHAQLRRDTANDMVAQYQAAGSASVSKAELTLGGKTYQGEHLSVVLAGATLELDMVSFDAGDPTILILQDAPEAAGGETAERTALIEMVGDSWEIR